MAEVRVTPQAEDELAAIIEYYERVGAEEFALILEQRILAKLRQLEHFPRSGRQVPELGDPSIRETIYRSYRIIYFVSDDDTSVEMLTIRHSSREFGRTGSA